MAQLPDLTLYLKFDEASGPALDSVIGIRPFTLVNTMARVAGLSGNAVAAQAAGDMCSAAEYFEWKKEPISVACYVYFNALPSANGKGPHPIVLMARSDGTTDGWFLGFMVGDTLVFRVIDTAGTPYEAAYTVVPGDVGQWIHFMGVLISNTSVKLYRNNIEVGSAVVGGFVKYTTVEPLRIGRNFDGAIDEAKVWSRALPVGDRAIAHEEIVFPVHVAADLTGELPYRDIPVFGFAHIQRDDRDRYLGVSTANALLYSRTGETWENGGEVIGAAVSYLFWNTEVHRWLAFGTGGVLRLSDDGINWYLPTVAVVWTTPRQAFVYLGVLLLAADSGLYRSNDGGMTWALVSALNFAGSAVRSITRAETLWVAVGADGKVSTSPDATNWTPRANPAGLTLLTCMARAPETGRLVVAGAGGFAMSSSDNGLTWALLATGLSGDARLLANANHKFILVGDTDMVSSSDHGVTWGAETYPLPDAPVALSHSAFGNWLLTSASRLSISGDGTNWETTTVASVIGGASAVTADVQPGYWRLSQDGLFSTIALFPGEANVPHFSIVTTPLPYSGSPYPLVLTPRNPDPQITAANLDCSLQELTAEVLYGPTDTLNICRYWELEIVPNVAYMRIMEQPPEPPETIDDTQIALSFPTNNGIDLDVKRLRYVIEACGDLQDHVKWASPWIIVGCNDTVVPLVIAFTAATYATFCVDITPYVSGNWYRLEWGEVGDGFPNSTQGQLLDPACVSHGLAEGTDVEVRAFQSFNGGVSYAPLTESNYLTFTVPPTTVVPLVISFAAYDYQQFQLNVAPFQVGGWYRIEWGPVATPFIYTQQGQYLSTPVTVEHGMTIGDDILIRAVQSFDTGVTWEPLSLSNVLSLEIPSGGGEALQLIVPSCYIDTFDGVLSPFVSGGYYRFEFGEVGVGFTNMVDGITFAQPANVFHGYAVGTLLQIRAYRSYNAGLTYDPDTVSNTVEVEVTALPNPATNPTTGNGQVINVYEPQFTLPYGITRLPGPIPSGFVIDLYWRAAPQPGDPLAPRIADRNALALSLAQLYSGRHRYRITMQLSNGYTYTQDYLLLTRAGSLPSNV